MDPLRTRARNTAADDDTLVQLLGLRLDEEAFRQLYARHTPAVYGVLWRLTARDAEASDLMKETWIRAVRHLRLFHGQSEFRAWLTGIAVNCYRDSRRRHTRQFTLADRSDDLTPMEVALSESRMPPPAVEEATVAALRKRGLLRARRVRIAAAALAMAARWFTNRS